MTNEDFAQLVLKQVPAEFHFEPTATYDADGDCIEFIAAPDSFYAERIVALITVYRSQEIVGSLLKGVSKFLRTLLDRVPGFRIEIRDGRIRLMHLFTAKLWSEPTDPNTLPGVAYRMLRTLAEKSGTEVDMGDLVLV